MDRKLKSATIKRLERELRDAFRTAYKAGHSGLRDYVENMSWNDKWRNLVSAMEKDERQFQRGRHVHGRHLGPCHVLRHLLLEGDVDGQGQARTGRVPIAILTLARILPWVADGVEATPNPADLLTMIPAGFECAVLGSEVRGYLPETWVAEVRDINKRELAGQV